MDNKFPKERQKRLDELKTKADRTPEEAEELNQLENDKATAYHAEPVTVNNSQPQGQTTNEGDKNKTK